MSAIFYKGKAYISGAGGSKAYGGTDAPPASLGKEGSYYFQWDDSGDVKIVYIKLDGAWHKIEGGDIIGGGTTYTDYAKYSIAGYKNMGMEGTINE